tara:strand:+ start:31 stop:687 length:657 start_codon:yes stop_codon:yes gene_type:complete
MPIPTTNATQELPAVNEILASVGQAPVSTLDQTNPDVAIAYDTLLRVSREVQAEGWSFNTEYNYKTTTDINREFLIPNNMLQVDLSTSTTSSSRVATVNSNKDVVRRNGKLYDKNKDEDRTLLTEEAGGTIYLDIIWNFDWVDLPVPFQDYIAARAATLVSSRIVGDKDQYQILQQKEALNRATILEYECSQGDYTFFGHPTGQNYYNSYQPYHALYR